MNNYSSDETIGRFILLSDGLSTWTLSLYHSQIISKATLLKHIRLDGFAKRYFIKFLDGDKEDTSILWAFCLQYEKLWKELILSCSEIGMYENTNRKLDLFFDLKERVSLFNNYGVKNHGYLS